MSRIHLTRIPVKQAFIDVNQHVNNLEYLRWMQDAATTHSAEQGWPLERYLAAGAGWFVRSHSIEYLHPARSGDVLLLYTWVHAMDARSSPRRYLFKRESDGLKIARAETLWVFVDFKTGRPTRIAKDVASSFPIVPESDPELQALLAVRQDADVNLP